MSATPNNPGAGWIGAASDPEHASRSVSDDNVAGQDALQTLLAFACIQDQASRRYSSDTAQRNSIQEDFGLDEVLHLVAARALSITGADGVAIALAEGEAIICRATIGRVTPDRGMRLDPQSGFSGECLRNGESVKCDDSETDSRVNALACRTLGARSMIAVPLSAKHRVIGLIEAFSSDAYGFNETDLKSLNLLGELILAAIRPEEEDRMAQLAAQLVPQPPSRVTDRGNKVSSLGGDTNSSAVAEIEEQPTSEATIREQEETLPEEEHSSTVAVESPTIAEAPPESVPEPLAPVAHESPKQERAALRVAVFAASVVVALLLAWGIVWKARHLEQGISANTRAGSQAMQTPDSIGSQGPQSPPVKPGVNPQITGIRHWSSADSSSVVVDLEDQVQYEAHSLDNPPRIYFDLHDTKMVANLMNQSIDVDDTFIKKIRIAQPVVGVTRVVLETKGDLEFSVSLDPNPYRLTINVHKPTGTPPPAAAPIILPKPSPAIEQGRKTASGEVRPDSSELKIALDAGHGGWDLGTVGRKGLLEKELVLDVVGRLGKLVSEKLGVQVIYTRADDSYLPLEKRAEIANLAHANLFLSVHANYSDLATARGVETFYTNTYSSLKARTDDDDPKLKAVNWTGVDIRAKVTDSHRLALDVQRSLYSTLVSRNPEIRDRGVKKAEYVVLTGTQMPAVLAEVSFVSSPADEDKLQNSEYRQQIAEALFTGVEKYWQEARHVKVAKSIN